MRSKWLGWTALGCWRSNDVLVSRARSPLTKETVTGLGNRVQLVKSDLNVVTGAWRRFFVICRTVLSRGTCGHTKPRVSPLKTNLLAAVTCTATSTGCRHVGRLDRERCHFGPASLASLARTAGTVSKPTHSVHESG